MAYSIKFYCRNCKVGKDGLASVEVSIIVNGVRKLLTLPRKEKPDEFKRMMESRKGNDLKRYVDSVKKNIDNAITEIAERGEALDTPTLTKYVRNGGVRIWTLRQVFDEFMELQRGRVGTRCGEGQMRKYELMMDRFFSKVDPSKNIALINRGMIEEYVNGLYKTMKPASVASDCTRLKAVFKYAFDNGYMKVNPFSMVCIEKGKPKEEWLDDDEIQKIRDLEGLSKDLEIARDMFLFQCNSGMSYRDMQELRKEDIREEENGVYSVVKHRCKTGVTFTSVVLPEGAEILRKWDFQVPRKSNPKYNLCLLKIETMAGLGKHLHSHLGRKVYGTTLLRSGVSMKAVSKALGHSTTQITQTTYAFLQSKDIINEIRNKAM